MRWRGIASAHSGTREWAWQRYTALYIGAFGLFLVFRFAMAPVADYEAWRQVFGGVAFRIAFLVFAGSVLLHAWLGLRSVYMDYLRPLGLRFFVAFATAIGLAGLGLWLLSLLLGGTR